jgi:membrane protein required for colicin V production
LIVEVLALLALVAGVYFSLRWSSSLEGFLQEFVAIPAEYSYHVAFAIVFLLVVIAVHLLGKLLTKIANLVALGLLNHLAGMLFGVLKMAIVVCAILFLIDAIDERYDIVSTETREGSMLYDPLVDFANKVYRAVIH